MSDRILITPRSLSKGDHPALQPLRDAGYELVFPVPGQTPDEATLLNAVGQCVGWLAGVEPVSPAVIEAAKRMRVISRNGTGADNLPLDLLDQKGIMVCRAEATNAQGVSELALALTLASLRDIVPTHIGMKSGNWPRRIGHEIAGARVAVVGLGAIGRAYADFCLALGAQVSGFDPYAPEDALTHHHFTRVSMNGALRDAQVVSLHAPMPQDGSVLIGRDELGLLADGAIVVNTARAGLVDSAAMLDALETGHVATYATDVFRTEPPEIDTLLTHPRVIMTSHIGGFTVGSVQRSTSRAVENLLQNLHR